jgi:hypothetical protein
LRGNNQPLFFGRKRFYFGRGLPPPPPHLVQGKLMSTMSDRAKRQSIIAACLRMNELGINQGT